MGLYLCNSCGYGSAAWIGKCPNCGEWNTMIEKEESVTSKGEDVQQITLTSLSHIKSDKKNRKSTGLFEFDRVLGGGFVEGEVVFLSGEPGVGKSTLLLQALQHLNSIYVSGEESLEQVKERAIRLGIKPSNLFFSNNLQIEGIISHIELNKQKPDILVIDSIQTVYSKDVEAPPGSINQLKETASQLVSFAKKNNITVILIGHITKDGDIAGPKTLEHLVDCVVNFEGERISNFRILRAAKNRFGSTDEIGIFQMNEKGLSEVKDPLIFLDDLSKAAPGKSIVTVIEGKRQLFYEIQSLVVPTTLSIPRRVVKGVDYNKVQLLLAVMKKYLVLPLESFDIYINVVGGVKITSPSADLGIIASLFSSIKNIPIRTKSVFLGEVGLLGEIRKGIQEKKIIQESKRLGFSHIYSSLNLTNIAEIKKLIVV